LIGTNIVVCYYCSVQANVEVENANVYDDDMDVDVDVDVSVHDEDIPTLDSMTVVSVPENDRTWMDNMQVNNDPLNYEFGGNDQGCVDGDQPEMEITLDDDLCNAQTMARSVVVNFQFNNDIFSSSSIQNGFKVGMMFESKAIFL